MTSQISARSFEQALPVIAGYFTDKTGISIVRSESAMTDGVSIYLPRRNNELDVTERELVETVAYLYHEAGHMLHTTMKELPGSVLLRTVHNLLEDIRVEKRMMESFPAARRYLTRLMEIIIEGDTKPADATQLSEAFVLQKYMVGRLRYELLEQGTVQQFAEYMCNLAHEKLPDGMLTKLNALMFQVADCRNTTDVADLAWAIVEMIQDEHEKAQDASENHSEQGDSPSSDTQSGAGQGNGAGQGTEADSSAQACGQSPANDDAENPNSTDRAGAGAGAGGITGQEAEQRLRRLLTMSEDEMEQGLGENLLASINQSVQTGRDCGFSMPIVSWVGNELKSNPVNLDELRGSINAIRTKTLQWMSSVSESEISHSHSGMKLDPSRICLSRFGQAAFVREEEGIDLNAAVSILIDRSSSMYSRIHSAVQAAVATLLAFDVPGLKTLVSVFPWHTLEGVSLVEGVGIIKRWEETPRQLACRINSLTTVGGTPMTEAILFAAADIIRREETLKILLVITDGEPNDMESAREIIKRARSSGIAVLGLGINHDTSAVFDSQYSEKIMDVGLLASSMVKLLKRALENRQQMI